MYKKQESMDKDLNFGIVPHGWTLCFLGECKRKEECMRYQMCLLAPEETTRQTCVLPTVLRRKVCPHFHPIKKVRMAAGFEKICDEIKAKHEAAIKAKLMAYLGARSTYYRYRKGERSLTPEQQEWILKLLRRYGYTEGIEFDSYREEYQLLSY